ncbi:hypothetical protein Leryth_013088 [Lithospermum erythrorhizon]|nr:hypothetical protein Leryth_013088 [Lithospermum erythrorhizon]
MGGVIILVLCIGILYTQQEQVSALSSMDLALKWGDIYLSLSPRSRRSMQDVTFHDQQSQMNIAPAPFTSSFDPNLSSKRRVHRGSDPIHNKSSRG